MADSAETADVLLRQTPGGSAFALLPPQSGGPAPTLLLLAWSGVDTLTAEPYSRVGRLLHAQGWNVASLDLPCHGADRRAEEASELEGWVARTARGEDFVAAFRQRVNDVLAHLVTTGIADSARLAAAGTSRGGFMAFHAAAGNPDIRAVAAFAPVADLRLLTEFAGQAANPLLARLALQSEVAALAGRAAWITIGDADPRVSTGETVAFARALELAAQARALPAAVVLRVVSAPGHCSLPEWHDAAAAWFQQEVTENP